MALVDGVGTEGAGDEGADGWSLAGPLTQVEVRAIHLWHP